MQINYLKKQYIRKDIGEGLFGMAYMNLHAVEVKALQEHENEIQELKDKNKTLEERLALLEAKVELLIKGIE